MSLARQATEDVAGASSRPRLVPTDFYITQRKFEVADAVERLLGPHAKRAYTLLLSIFLYGALWAYTAVFASSLAANIPTALNGYHTCNTEDSNADCNGPYRLFLAVFACLVIPLTCLDFEEQISVQVMMSVGTCGGREAISATPFRRDSHPHGRAVADATPHQCAM